jgi:hypothetical protein
MAKGLLPQGIVVAANPMIAYHSETNMYEIREFEDKAKNTAAAIYDYGIPAGRLVVMGDSGGDGPHFKWGASVGAYLIGSMTKPSLEKYCKGQGIKIDTRFGLAYGEGEKKDKAREMEVDFVDLVQIIENAIEGRKI